MTNTISTLRQMGACTEALEWLGGQQSWEQAWRHCHRGDWMLWLLGRLSGEPWSDGRRPLVACCCECARLAWPDMPAESRAAVETAERWSRGEATDGELQLAAYDADAAADAAYAAYAAEAAVYAAYNAAADASAANEAAAAAVAAAAAARAAYAYTADYAAYAAADTLRQCADIVRRRYPESPKLGEPRAYTTCPHGPAGAPSTEGLGGQAGPPSNLS